jgi:hypothetical protein
MAVPTSRSVWVLELGTSVVLAGDGITGDPTGTTGESPITTTPISLIAEPFPTVTISPTEVRQLIMPAEFMAAECMAEQLPEEPAPSMGLRRHTASQVRVPERSAVLTMAASRGGTPSVGVQASAEEEDFMAVAGSMVAADPTEAVVEGRLRSSRSQQCFGNCL